MDARSHMHLTRVKEPHTRYEDMAKNMGAKTKTNLAASWDVLPSPHGTMRMSAANRKKKEELDALETEREFYNGLAREMWSNFRAAVLALYRKKREDTLYPDAQAFCEGKTVLA